MKLDFEPTKDIQPFIEAYGKASDRSRGAYYFILLSAILVITAFLKVWPAGWAQSRVKLFADTYGVINVNLRKSPTGELDHDPFLFPSSNDKVQSSVNTIKQLGITSMDDLKARLESSEKSLEDARKVTLPILGVAFDTNDLGIVEGVGQVSLSILLLFYLSRERANLRLVLGQARRLDCLLQTYLLLSLVEVINTPPTLLVDNRASVTRRQNTQYVIVCLSAVSHGIVSTYDWMTLYPIGFTLSPIYAWIIVIFELTAAILLIIVASRLIGQLQAISALWQDAHAEILATYKTDPLRHLILGKA